MKSKFILFLIVLQNLTFGYSIMDSWLATPGNHSVYLTHEVDSLSSSWNLDFQSCINAVNAHSVTNTPVLVAASTTSETADCIVKYETIYEDYPANSIVDYGSIAVCRRTEFGEYSSITIIVNDSVRNVTFGSGGNTDINSVIMHELVHSLGLYENFTDNTTLMFHEYTGITSLTNDEINGIKHVYEKPSIQILSPYTFAGDTVKVFYKNDSDDIELQVRTPTLLEHNSVTPPDISLVGFFTGTQDYYSGLSATFDSLGNGVYNFKTKVNSLIDYMESNLFKFRSFNDRSSWIYGDYWQLNSPCGERLLKITPKPTIESPTNNGIYHVRPGNKGSVTDTLAIKVKVPSVLGSYPDVNIKIDDAYVNPAQIIFDSSENVWVYNWDLSTVSTTGYGKRFVITAEIDGDPTDFDAVGVYLVEAIFHEDFETITDLVAEGWAISTYIYPTGTTPYGWKIGNDPTGAPNKCVKSLSTYSLSFFSHLFTPVFYVPNTDKPVKLEYRLHFTKLSEPNTHSRLYFDVFDQGGNQLTTTTQLFGVKGAWIDLEHDLSQYTGQSIKIRWRHVYSSTTTYCNNTSYSLDDIIIYTIPDIEGPNIDFIAGNSAEINEDMNLLLVFNDASTIDAVTADYSIEGDSGTITLYPSKNTYNYTGTISARDHESAGSIVFKIKDSVGNQTVSKSYSINWAQGGGGILTPPENILFTALNDSTYAITWDIVAGATGYKVFSSIDPYGTFNEDTTGTFTESRKWEKVIDGNKYFYYIIATDGAKEESQNIIPLGGR